MTEHQVSEHKKIKRQRFCQILSKHRSNLWTTCGIYADLKTLQIIDIKVKTSAKLKMKKKLF